MNLANADTTAGVEVVVGVNMTMPSLFNAFPIQNKQVKKFEGISDIDIENFSINKRVGRGDSQTVVISFPPHKCYNYIHAK